MGWKQATKDNLAEVLNGYDYLGINLIPLEGRFSVCTEVVRAWVQRDTEGDLVLTFVAYCIVLCHKYLPIWIL